MQGSKPESGSVLIEFSLVILLLAFIVFGTLVIADLIQYNLKVAQVNRQVAKYTLRECSALLRSAGQAPPTAGRVPDLPTCISRAAENALVQGSHVLPDMKVVVTVYLNTNGGTPPTVEAFAEFSTDPSTVSGESSRFDSVRVFDTLSPLLAHAGVVTIVEVFAPDNSMPLPFKSSIMASGETRYEVAVF